MRGINKHIIVGVVGRDPETKYIGEKAMTQLSIATSERWTDRQTGEVKEQTDWHRVVVWGKPAEFAGEHIKKGARVYVEGKVRTRSYEKDGVKHYTTETIADVVELVAGPSKSGDEQQRPAQQQRRPAPAPASGGGGPSVGDDFDDIPF